MSTFFEGLGIFLCIALIIIAFVFHFNPEQPEEEVIPSTTTVYWSELYSLETSLAQRDSLINSFLYLDDLIRAVKDSLKVYEDKNKGFENGA